MTGGPWVYQQSEAGDGVDSFPLYTVGYYDPTGRWEPESDHTTAEAAAARVHYLNGGEDPPRKGAESETCPTCEGRGEVPRDHPPGHEPGTACGPSCGWCGGCS